MESFEQTVSADNLSASDSAGGGGLSEGGPGRENLAAEAVAASVLSQVLAPSDESPNDNDTLSPLLEVVDNLEVDGNNLNQVFSTQSSHLNLVTAPPVTRVDMDRMNIDNR